MTLPHESLDVFAHKFAVSFFPATFKVRDDTFVGCLVAATITQLNFVFVSTSAVEDFLPRFFGEALDHCADIESVFLPHCHEALQVPRVSIYPVIRTNRPLGQGEVWVKYQVRVDF